MRDTMTGIVAGAIALGLLQTAVRPAAAAPKPVAETVAIRFSQALPNVPGKSFTTAVVNFAPGARAAPHRHGQAFVYAVVLAGAVRSQLDDEPARVYGVGQDWSEKPGAHHVLTENVSRTLPTRLLVVFVADTGATLKDADPAERTKP